MSQKAQIRNQQNQNRQKENLAKLQRDGNKTVIFPTKKPSQ